MAVKSLEELKEKKIEDLSSIIADTPKIEGKIKLFGLDYIHDSLNIKEISKEDKSNLFNPNCYHCRCYCYWIK